MKPEMSLTVEGNRETPSRSLLQGLPAYSENIRDRFKKVRCKSSEIGSDVIITGS
jgi:hypothetical protein